MTCLVPRSNGEPLREFNPCHQDDGKFAVRGQGRCLGDAARREARSEYARDRHYSPIVSADKRDARRAQVQQQADARRDVRSYVQRNPLPAYMQQDVARAWKTDRAVVMEEPVTAGTHTSGSAYIGGKFVALSPKVSQTKTERLSVLRHELGHIDRTKLGTGGPKILGYEFGGLYTEEIRAWKNAIRNSRGRVDWGLVRRGLHSYMSDDAAVTALGLGDAFVRSSPQSSRTFWRQRVVDRHIGLLKRYARRVRKAS